MMAEEGRGGSPISRGKLSPLVVTLGGCGWMDATELGGHLVEFVNGNTL